MIHLFYDEVDKTCFNDLYLYRHDAVIVFKKKHSFSLRRQQTKGHDQYQNFR